MKIVVLVKPHARREGVEPLPDGSYRVSVHAPPVAGKANARVIRLVAKYFGVAPSCVTICRGESARKKLLEIE